MNLTFIRKSLYIGATFSIVFILTGVAAYKCFHKSVNNNPNHIIDEVITLKNSQPIRVVHGIKPEKGLLIYIGDAEHKKATTENANKFAELSYFVAVFDNQEVLKIPQDKGLKCLNIGKRLVDISNLIQDHYELDTDDLPILVGNDQGAAIVYTALAQAEKHSFHAGISIHFNSTIHAQTQLCAIQAFSSSQKPNQTNLTPAEHLPTSWYVFQSPADMQNLNDHDFTNTMGNAKLTVATDQQSTPLSEAIQILQWLDPRLEDQISSDNSDSDLPLIEVPVDETTPNIPQTDSLAIILTGDGGWAEIDKNVANFLAAKGIPTVALDSLSYFWKVRKPEETATDIESVISEYSEKWNKQNIILIGYSFGADALPFIANKLSPDVQKSISLIALLGLGKTAAFEFHLSSWMDADKSSTRLPVMPEINNMRWANSICIYGVDDIESHCKETADAGVKTIEMTGDHHFDKKYEELVQHIIDNNKPKNR